jgi:acetyl esterase
MDPELFTIVLTAAQHSGAMPDWPTPRPADGETEEQWASRVQRLRDQHDALALYADRFQGPIRDERPTIGLVDYADVDVRDGRIAVRIYRPDIDGPVPAVLLFHGGAWWMGGGAAGFAINDELCRLACAELGAVVLNVDYRLAPEHPYPTQLDDCDRALEWTIAHAGELDVDVDRISVLGISSGGNVAAALAQRLRLRGDATLRSVLLLAPALDLSANSRVLEIEGAADVVSQLLDLYTRGAIDPTDPEVSPVLAPELDGLPPTVVVTGEFDELRGDALRYVERLRDVQVPVVHIEAPMTHGLATPEVRRAVMADLLDAASALV